MYIDGHWDLRPVNRWPHSITDDDLKAVIGAFFTATARVSPNLNPHAHCHDAIAPFSVMFDRINDAGSLFSGLSMRCTSTPPCWLARQKKARSAVSHRGRWHTQDLALPVIMKALPCSHRTHQLWSLHDLDRAEPDDACVVALVLHCEAGPRKFAHKGKPILFAEAFFDLAALAEQHDIGLVRLQSGV